jgi:uncharacterized membrane protein
MINIFPKYVLFNSLSELVIIKGCFMSQMLKRVFWVVLICLGISLGLYAIFKKDEADEVGNEKPFPIANHATVISGLIPDSGTYSLLVNVSMKKIQPMFANESINCNLNVTINNENGLNEMSEIKRLYLAEETASGEVYFSSDTSLMLQKGKVKVTILRNGTCEDGRFKGANLILRRKVGLPTERYLLRLLELLFGVWLTISGATGLAFQVKIIKF